MFFSNVVATKDEVGSGLKFKASSDLTDVLGSDVTFNTPLNNPTPS